MDPHELLLTAAWAVALLRAEKVVPGQHSEVQVAYVENQGTAPHHRRAPMPCKAG